MLALTLAVALAATFLVRAQDNDTATVTAAFMNAKIVPDVLSSFAPVLPLLVTFKQADGSSIEVTAGMQLTIAQTANEPTFALVSGNAAIQGKPYLIAMVDPDAPTPQNTSISQVRHFLAPDFVSDGPVAGTWPMTNRTPALSEYMGPHPPDGSDAHRYVILCYLQAAQGDITAPTGFNASNILNFNLTTFISGFSSDLTLIAGTFFMVAPDATSTTSSSGSGTSLGTGSSPTSTTAAAMRGFSAAPALMFCILLATALSLLRNMVQ